MRPIDADTLKQVIYEDVPMKYFNARNLDKAYQNMLHLLDVVNQRPTLDAVPVVRCKDCKYYKTESGECPANNGDDPYYSWIPKPDWYCAEGKPKEDA